MLSSTHDMKRSGRRAYASLYACCVLRAGRRLGVLCGSEKVGRGCAAVLLLAGLVAGTMFLLLKVSHTAGVLAGIFASPDEGVTAPAVDVWGRDTSADLHFLVRSLAFRDMSHADQQTERELHARRVAEDKRNKERTTRTVLPATVLSGEVDPNAFRLSGKVSGDGWMRPVDAVVEGFAVLRPHGTAPLPHLRTRWRTFTPAELYERYDALDFIYSFVNGTEANHLYRKQLRTNCGAHILALEKHYFATGGVLGAEQTSATNTTSSLLEHFAMKCSVFRSLQTMRNIEFLRLYGAARNRLRVDERDRETDELRHSLRSLEQHVRWHRGRVVMVSPGHHPTWLDGARNFLAGACGDAHVQALRSSGTHLRVTTVHQDAVMPYGLRLTANSHVIEQHLWRVRNTTAVHVYMNDDYFVNRDVAVTDLFNEYGGTIVRTEWSEVPDGRRADGGNGWLEGVWNTQLFNIVHLEHLEEDYLPKPLIRNWTALVKPAQAGRPSAGRQLLASLRARVASAVEAVRRKRAAESRDPADEAAKAELEQEVRYMLIFEELLRAANTSFAWEAAHTNDAARAALPDGRHKGALPRYYATHAPFVYCTNMFRHWSVRFRDTLALMQLNHRERLAQDLFVPFLYNAFIMARPWEASAQFLPYLLELKEAAAAAEADARAAVAHVSQSNTTAFYEALWNVFPSQLAKYAPNATISLDNEDGCAPATQYRNPTADVMFMRASNDLQANNRTMGDVQRQNPIFFNINAGFSSPEAADQLRTFLHDKFPTPGYLEVDGADEDDDAALHATFDALMALPVVGVVSDAEGVCPLVRSLSLAFAGHHRGGVHVSVVQHGGATLREARAALGHRVVSAMPASACAYDPKVTSGGASEDEGLQDVARRVLGEMHSGVVLPATCGAGAGGAGLRVRGFVVDARTAGAPVRSAAALREALAVPAQTLALEDFRAVAVGPSAGDVVLVVSREDAAAKAVHWVTGASESDLLVTYPLPVEAYEDMSAPLRWAVP